MKKKLMTLAAAVELIGGGQMLGVGGNSLHRSPAAFCHELAGSGRKGFTMVGAAPGYASDVLCAAGCVDKIYFGFFGFENEFGLAPGFRQGCQEGRIKAVESS